MGSGLISLNIELKQDDSTVCCGHTDVYQKILIFLLYVYLKVGPYDNWVMSESDVPTPLRLCRGHI